MSGTNSDHGTGGYGGASMAIPMILLVFCFPQILLFALIFGLIVVAVAALAALLH